MLADIVTTLRALGRRPGFLAATILPLAGGLCAAVVVFSLVYRLLLGPLGLPNADRVLGLSQDLPALGGSAPMSAASLLAVVEQQSAFGSVASLRVTDRTMTERGEPLRVKVASVTPSFFAVGATRPVLGRLFNADDARLSGAQNAIFGEGPMVILSDLFWRSRFGADPAVIGKSLMLDGHWYEIVGVMPPEFRYPLLAQVWIPLGFGGLAPRDFGGFYFQSVARLKPEVSLPQARRDLERIARELRPAAPSVTRGLTFEAETIRQRRVGDHRASMLLLLSLTLVIVLGVSANIAQIVLARALTRQRDFALRSVLGASQGQLIRLLLVEGLTVTLLGWGLGISLAGLFLRVLGRAVPFPWLDLTNLSLNGAAVGFSLGIALASGLVVGLVPALALRQKSLLAHLNEGAVQSTPSRHQRYLQRFLLVAQLALALVLVASGTFLLASFARVQAVRPGFDPRGLATLDLNLPSETYDTARLLTFTSQAVQALRGIPGVSGAATGLRLPVLDEGGGVWFYLPNHAGSTRHDQIPATFNAVSPGFFSTLRVPILAGRDFTAQDRVGGEPVAIIDEVLARKFFGGENPIGRSLVLTPWPDVHRRIIGVVAAVRFGGLKSDLEPTVYVSAYQIPWGQVRLVVRSRLPLAAILDQARRRVWEIDRRLAFDAVGAYENRIEAISLADRWALRLVLALGILGLVLSGSCVYAATTQVVSQRFREWGIRLALGSPPAGIVENVVLERVPDVLSGFLLGLAGVWVAGRWARFVLFEISPLDPLLLGISVAVLATAAFLAIYLPARRAARTDPMIAMR